MAKIAALLKIYPEGPSTLNKVKVAISSLKGGSIEVMRIEEEPIAFGLKALNVLFVIPDEEGTLVELERKICSIPGVSSVEVIRASRL